MAGDLSISFSYNVIIEIFKRGCDKVAFVVVRDGW